MAFRPVVIVNPINTNPHGHRIAIKATDEAVKALDLGGKVQAVNILSLCKKYKNLDPENTTARIKQYTIARFDGSEARVAFVGSFKVEDYDHDPGFSSGAFIEHRGGDEQKAKLLYELILKSWNESPISHTTDFKIGGNIQYSVAGNRQAKAEPDHIRLRQPLSYLLKDLTSLISELRQKGHITEQEAKYATIYSEMAIADYRNGGAGDRRLSEIILETIKKHITSELTPMTRKVFFANIESTALEYCFSYCLFAKRRGIEEHIPSIIHGLGSVKNQVDRAILESERAIQNHVNAFVEFVHSTIS